MSTKKLQNASLILDRVKEAYELKSDAELAKFLEKDPSTISTWRRRNTVDYNLLFSKCHELNANYIVHGDTPIFRIPGKKDSGQVIRELKNEYKGSEIIERIDNLSLNPDEKMALLQTYLKILEQREKKQKS